MLRLALSLCLAALASGADVSLDGIEVYGSERLTVEEARTRYGKSFEEYARMKGRSGAAAERAMEVLRKRTEERILKDWAFAWVRLSWSDFVAGGARKGFMTVDVVEPKDRKTRLAFKPAPTRSLPDPGGLLAEWTRYMDLGWKLFRRGELSTNHDSCLSHFCVWGAQAPDLRAYEEKFVAHAKDHKEALLKVMREDRDPEKRANSVYLLSYLPETQESARLIAEALDDPAVEVRTAALTVYADYSVYHKDIFLPVTKIQAALDFPSAEDRSKAMAVVAGMAANPDHRRFLIGSMGDKMIHLLESAHPTTQDTAYAALGILSKEAFDRRDTQSWRRWLERAKVEVESEGPVETKD